MKPERKLLALGLLLCLSAVAALAVMTVRERRALAGEVQQRLAVVAAGTLVRTAKVGMTPPSRTVVVTSEVRANQRATLYAKVSGYLREVRVDKGDRVRKGDLLATLESPETDEAVVAARADLLLRKQVLERDRALRLKGFVSQSDLDTAEANVKVAVSNLERTSALKAYEQLRAPFSGTVIARSADPGALLTAAQPLLELAEVDHLRVAVQLGQDDAALVKAGDAVTLDLASGSFPARVSRISSAIDSRTRTMLAEIDLLRPPPGMLPGAFVQVTLTLRGPPRPVVPAEALVSQEGKLLVPTVVNGKVHLVPVRTGVDDGKNVEVVSGLQGGELIALSLGSDAAEGEAVQVAQ